MNIEKNIQKLTDSYHTLLDVTNQLHNFKDSDSGRLELAESVQLHLKDYENGIQAVELEIEDEPEGNLKRQHEVSVDRLNENLRLAKNRFRKAQVQAKKNAELSWEKQRELLFANASSHNPESATHKSTEERVVSKSEDITTTLKRVHQMASTEVVKSQLNIEELESSTRAMTELDERYNAVNLLLAGSTKLVKHLEQADRKDRQYMIMALSFLGATLLWIVWRRILKAPTMLLLWALAKVLGIARFFGSVASSGASHAVEDQQLSGTVVETIITATESVIRHTTEVVKEAVDFTESVVQEGISSEAVESAYDTVAAAVHNEL